MIFKSCYDCILFLSLKRDKKEIKKKINIVYLIINKVKMIEIYFVFIVNFCLYDVFV